MYQGSNIGGGRVGGRWSDNRGRGGGNRSRTGYNKNEGYSARTQRGRGRTITFPDPFPGWNFSMHRGAGKDRWLVPLEKWVEKYKANKQKEEEMKKAAAAAEAEAVNTISERPDEKKSSENDATQPVEKSIDAPKKTGLKENDGAATPGFVSMSESAESKNNNATVLADLVEKTAQEKLLKQEEGTAIMDSVKKTVAVMADSTSAYMKTAVKAYAEETKNNDICKGCPHCNASSEAIRTFAALMGNMAVKFKEFADSFGGTE